MRLNAFILREEIFWEFLGSSRKFCNVTKKLTKFQMKSDFSFPIKLIP